MSIRYIETEILIDASPEQVWKVLTNFNRYPLWNPFIKSIDGGLEVGKILTVEMQPPNANSMVFRPKILSIVPNTELRWLGKFRIKGLFDGEHYFKLLRQEDGHTKFIHGEKFSGILVGLLHNTLDKTKEGFELMNKSIKVECEK